MDTHVYIDTYIHTCIHRHTHIYTYLPTYIPTLQNCRTISTCLFTHTYIQQCLIQMCLGTFLTVWVPRKRVLRKFFFFFSCIFYVKAKWSYLQVLFSRRHKYSFRKASNIEYCCTPIPHMRTLHLLLGKV